MPKAGIEPAARTHVHLGFTVQRPAIGLLRLINSDWIPKPQNKKAGKLQNFAEAARSPGIPDKPIDLEFSGAGSRSR